MKKRLENGDDYFAVNPKGQVPALLLDDGTLLTEGVAIMQYLADSVPDRQLLAPVNSISRYKTIEWLNYIATELHKGFNLCFALIHRKSTTNSFARSWRRSCNM
ncbi:glutathione S-transferase [Escherichia coli]|uniref:Glutathione S-transferase n=1 Tax=Escherichia coli TaxID=562 RepID=A0A376S8B4_ECOLX|nr:glutathione S-transferase [Escherichia coli]